MRVTNPPSVAVLAAMPEEMIHVTRLLERARVRREAPDPHGPRVFERATLVDAPLVLLTTGIGMVAAAAATEAVIARFSPRVVLNFGCAGAHREDILPGDVIVGTACIAFDHGFLPPGGAFVAEPARLFVDGAQVRLDTLPVSEPLLAVAELVAGLGAKIEPWPRHSWPAGVEYRAPRAFFGPVASSDRFTQDADALRALHNRHASLCEDMEAAAIAQVCTLHRVPFFTVKDVSNTEFHATTTGDAWETLNDELGKRAAAFLFAVLRQVVGSSDATAALRRPYYLAGQVRRT